MHSQVDRPDFPDGVAIIGSDSTAGTFSIVYFDERGVSRLFDVVAGDRTLTWRRDDPKLAQSNTITAQDDGNALVGKVRGVRERRCLGR